MKSPALALLLAFTAFGSTASFAGSWGEPLDEPKALLKMIEALEKSGQFSSSKTTAGEKFTSYHLRSIRYLGTVESGKEKFLIAATHYIRSSVSGQDTPPARGHSFIVVFHPDFTIASFAKEELSDCHMEGNRLCRDDTVVIDFDNRCPFHRRHGYTLEGGQALPYFLSDRITDEQWNDAEFLKRNPEVAELRKQEIEAEKRDAEARKKQEEKMKREIEPEKQPKGAR